MSKILLVDDESYVIATVAAKLNKLGHETRTANDGMEGFTLAQAFLPDLIISDLQMPTLDGLGMAQRMAASELTRTTPVILLTGRAHLIPREDLERTCVKQLIDKPFSVRDLVASVQQHLTSAA